MTEKFYQEAINDYVGDFLQEEKSCFYVSKY